MCPEPELLASYVDGRVDDRERAALVRHLAECERCYDLVIDTTAVLGELDETDAGGTRAPRSSSRAVKIVVGSFIGLAAALLLVVRVEPDWWRQFARAGGARTATLAGALGDIRTIEGRLTGGFPHRPLRTPTRSTAQATDNLALLAAAGDLRQAAESEPSPENRHAWGVGALLVLEHETSIAELEAAAAARPRDATYTSDLAVAYMTRGDLTGRREDLQRALDLTARALDLDPGLREALFNRALLAERLDPPPQAAAAWERYLQTDADSAWAAEARIRRARLQ